MMNPILAPIALWLYTLMILAAPPNRPQYEPAAIESVAQAQERYRGISETIAKVAYDPAEAPVAGNRAYTAALLLSIALHESSFRRDVDLGIGRMRLAKQGWNDHGRSWCMMQVNLGTRQVPDTRPGHDGRFREESARQTAEGWWGTELLADREKCFRAGLHLVRGTWGCHGGSVVDALTQYAGGKCYTASDEAKASEADDQDLLRTIRSVRYASRMRVERANKWVTTRPKTWVDQDVVQVLLQGSEAAPQASQTLPGGASGQQVAQSLP